MQRRLIIGKNKRSRYGHEPRPLEERFWEKVDKNGPIARPGLAPCWLWTSYRAPSGYGQFSVPVAFGGPFTLVAHRVAYQLVVGPIPPKKLVLHLCDVKECVRPSHLRIGTNDENMQDAIDRRRFRDGENHYLAKLTAAQAVEIRRSKLSGAQLARMYKVCPATICAIQKGKIWKHAEST